MITVQRAPAYATVQDLGRRGFRGSGVPAAGAMDSVALATLNILVGNPRNLAGLEIALTGGSFYFDEPVTFAIGGAETDASLDGRKLDSYRAYRANAGQILKVDTLFAGRFFYLTVSGGIDADNVLGSRSTYLPGGFGGSGGRRLRSGDTLTVGHIPKGRKHQVADSLPMHLRASIGNSEIRFVRANADAATVDGSYRLSPSSDRTGYRLGDNHRDGGASITSEPVCPGVIQLPPSGEPIILMADAPTIGGYRVMGGVISADLGMLAQKLPGERIELVPISIERARRELERLAEVETLIEEWCLS